MRHAPVLLSIVLLFLTASTARAAEIVRWRKLDPWIDEARASSPTFRRLWDEAETRKGVDLRIVQRPQPNSSMRAHSELRVGGESVTGEVVLPLGGSRDRSVSLLGHELAHVLQLVGALEVAADDPRGEGQAVAIEKAILSELASRGSSEEDVALGKGGVLWGPAGS